jgi:hypothetical protein
MVWRLNGPCGLLNFPEVHSYEEAEFLAPVFELMRYNEEHNIHR